MSHRLFRAGLVLAGALGALALPSAALAGDCPAQPATQTFAPWGDQAWYVLAPDGGFENDASGWTLTDGAAVQEGNQTTTAAVGGDHRSLALPSGAKATSPAFCVDLNSPTVRLFARNDGGIAGVLTVAVRFRLLGAWQSLPIGAVTGDGEWRPSLQLPIVVNALSILGDHSVELVLAPARGDWSVDDVSVDPYSKG